MEVISKNLVRYRSILNLTQLEVSKRSGIPRENISRYESGKGNPPTIPILKKFAKVYKCKLKDFFEEPENIIHDVQLPYGDPVLKQIHELLTKYPEYRKFILGELKILDSQGMEEVREIINILSKMPKAKRLALLELLDD